MKNADHISDLYAEVQQSTCNKLINSVGYPFKVIEKRQDFPGCSTLAAKDNGPIYEYSKDEIKAMLQKSVTGVRSRTRKESSVSVGDQVYSFAGSVIEQAKKVVDVANSSGADYEGPDKKEMQGIVEGGIEGLVDALGDFGVYAWCPYLRVVIKKQPTIALRSPRIDLNGISIEVTATGELWAKYPWWNCYKWCTKWEKVHKCDRIASLTVSPDVLAEAHANIESSAARIFVRAEIDKLRLDYEILNKILLEGIANDDLRGRLVFVYDAAQLVATVPVLQSKFAIERVDLPDTQTGIGVGIVLRQI